MLAEDPETGELAYQEVVQTFVRDTDKTIHVKADGIEIETTSEHPFWVEGKGFVNANSLQQGDMLRLATGEKARVEDVWEETKEEKVQVYNLEVAEFPTYFVSELGVLVHNTCNGGGRTSASIDYRNVFFNKHPELEGKVIVHHSVEQQVLKRYPGLFTKEEINAYEMLRGIPKEVNSNIHLSKIRIEWNNFYKRVDAGEIPLTKESFLNKAKEIDKLFGGKFNPPK